ncbi:MAG: TonB-dependent receptor [Acidobacteria bacterium]|nr:TonB-dependent receptor [Acidobacteriota bacterium]
MRAWIQMCVLVLGLGMGTAATAGAESLKGVVADSTGAPLADVKVTVRDVATGQVIEVTTGADGRYDVSVPAAGEYLVSAVHPGFSEATRTVVIEAPASDVEVPLTLDVAGLSTAVVVTASRAERDARQIPLHIETIGAERIAQTNQTSTGDALTMAANVTPVGNGPFGVRPRLRGLDSTRLLVLVDGERLNTARQATDRTGAEVGLIAPDAIARMEVVNGAGTLMYGSDALAGTINIITNEAAFTPSVRWLYGLNGFYSSNEDGRRGTATLGFTVPRMTLRVQAGAEEFGSYRAGALTTEDTRTFFTSGQLTRRDTIDNNFGFRLGAFPDPFNAPYVRTDNAVINSQASGNFVTATSLIKLAERHTLRFKYQRRRMNDIGFPDFDAPYFFNTTSLPFSNLDRASVRYEAQAVTPWLANLSATAYYQRTERQLRNTLPVQFPAPTPVTLFPIAVMRLNVVSETEQRVWTPGVDLQAVIVPAAHHRITTGLTFYRDRSSDRRLTTTTTSMVGQVIAGARGPAPVVFPAPVVLGPASVARPVRVPNASFQDIALFAQEEWRIAPRVLFTAGVRGDFFTVTTEATPGYEVASLIVGARPAIDAATLPDVNGATYQRNSLTGDAGLVFNQGGRVSPFLRVGRSYRHPNLEEMLFAGPATVGSIVPNIAVKPETGVNIDTGAKFTLGRMSGGAYVFVNQYQNFIAQDLVVATTASGPLAQATNYADVRIGGVEYSADAPFVVGRGVLMVSTSGAFMRGTITDGVNPLDGASLANTPADNITPSRVLASARYTGSAGRWWLEYGVRAQGRVDRVAETVLDSPFLIPQDLLSLDSFVVQRVGAGITLTRGVHRVGLTLAVENLGNVYYREHFQFAPARGRTFTVGLNLGAF